MGPANKNGHYQINMNNHIQEYIEELDLSELVEVAIEDLKVYFGKGTVDQTSRRRRLSFDA
jgi:hypothetical protein